MCSVVLTPSRPMVTIVIPCYNLGRYLEECVRSVITQQGINWHVVVVDDASTDETPEVCAKLRDYINVIRNPTNLHVSRSRNIGIALSDSEYILPLDADDMLPHDRVLAELVAELERDRLLDIAYGSMEVLEEDGRRWVSGWPPKSFSYEAQMQGKDQIPYSALYRRRMWERIGGYRTGYESVEDALFWTQAVALSFTPRKVTEAPTLLYRMRSDSLSHEADKTKLLGQGDWHKLAPRKAQWTPYTYEPVKVSVVVSVEEDEVEGALHTIDCVWSQTLPAWECIVRGPGAYPPFVKDISSPLRGDIVLQLYAGTHLENTFLERLYKHWQETGELICQGTCGEKEMACGTCGKKLAGVAVAPRSFTNMNMGVQEAPGQEEGKMLVEYIGEGSWTIRGPVTQTIYYFDLPSGHNVKSMWVADAKPLVATYDTLVREYEAVPA